MNPEQVIELFLGQAQSSFLFYFSLSLSPRRRKRFKFTDERESPTNDDEQNRKEYKVA